MDPSCYPTEESQLQLIKCKLKYHQRYCQNVKKQQQLLQIKVKKVDQEIQTLQKMIKQQEQNSKQQISQTDQTIYDLQKQLQSNDIKIKLLQDQIAQCHQKKKMRQEKQLERDKQMQIFHQYVEKAQRFYKIYKFLKEKSRLTNSLHKLIHM